MIDIDETGMKKLKELAEARFKRPQDFTDWEFDFIGSVRTANYKWLTSKQQTTVGSLYDKIILGKR